ncbi:hypothetical protein L2E82_39564 [Cichorium intybus]|uniref:Uncharacterized protein n=1 Tax=Cichorium intybus TaxID=13427 RepID=A0ACB9AIX8_CICIN|nr:hypothetical protein L2E82_39564 [Cichorium intybus]
MEAQPPGGGGSRGGGGEMRKVHIVYFLSHKGRIEHPHLIRVHHHSRKGVRLRDVKRWLSELRGKDMPESFAWSYKRKYKGGYVWQDLLDEDLITPISDNEYVLKGSEISSVTITNDHSSYGEKEVAKPKSSPSFKVDIKDPKIPLANETEDFSINSSTKTSFEIEELPSYGSETSTEDTTKQQEDHKFVGPLINRRNSTSTMNVSSAKDKNIGQVVKGEKFGGSERVSRGHWPTLEQQRESRKEGSRKSHNLNGSNNIRFPAGYKFINGPYCSQCGMQFNPEKLHTHMKSCRGMKALVKAAKSNGQNQKD